LKLGSLSRKQRASINSTPRLLAAGNGHLYTDQARVSELERMVGRLTMENDLLKKALLRLEALSRSLPAGGGK
jgi:hypothetical protein